VIALLDKETYALQRQAEQSGLLSNRDVRSTIEAAANAAAGTISTTFAYRDLSTVPTAR
jgi:hypothetical protein